MARPGPPEATTARAHEPGRAAPDPPAEEWRPIVRADGLEATPGVTRLAPEFAPFFRHFVSETLRTGGRVELAVGSQGPAALLLRHDGEGYATVFTEDRGLAASAFERARPLALFAPFPVGPSAEPYGVYALELGGWEAPWGFSHPMRLARPQERAEVAELLTELHGPLDDRWLSLGPGGRDRCFVAPVDGRLAGAGWVTTVDGYARLHSLGVRPRFRGTGIGRDLWLARVLWARSEGACRAICEIAESNAPSRAISERGGMRPVDRLFLLGRGRGTLASREAAR
jgi:GNAT superfamily N-acetyltransferase